MAITVRPIQNLKMMTINNCRELRLRNGCNIASFFCAKSIWVLFKIDLTKRA